MNKPTTPAIVVAVPLDGAEAALDFAAEEALLAEAPLHLVHVLRIPAVEAYAGVYGGILEDADGALAAAVKRARHLTGDRVPVTSERVDDGALIPRLVRQADRARLIVLQHRRLGRARRLIAGSTVNGVAARAAVPVVSVPDTWTSATRPPVVTACLQDVHEAESLLRTAFAEATLRGARLTILHAWWLDSGFDVVAVDEDYRTAREAQTRRELGPTLDALREEFPGVESILQVPHAPAVEALLDASEVSSLLVLGRRHHLLPLGSHLGPVARHVIDHSDCPVLLAPEERSPASPEVRSHLSGVLY